MPSKTLACMLLFLVTEAYCYDFFEYVQENRKSIAQVVELNQGRHGAVVYTNGALSFWNLLTGKKEDFSQGFVRASVLNKTTRNLIIATQDKEIQVIDTDNNEVLSSLTVLSDVKLLLLGRNGEILSIVFKDSLPIESCSVSNLGHLQKKEEVVKNRLPVNRKLKF